jgi:hypothetical protein
MHRPVEHGIGIGGVPDALVPELRGDLAGDDAGGRLGRALLSQLRRTP